MRPCRRAGESVPARKLATSSGRKCLGTVIPWLDHYCAIDCVSKEGRREGLDLRLPSMPLPRSASTIRVWLSAALNPDLAAARTPPCILSSKTLPRGNPGPRELICSLRPAIRIGQAGVVNTTPWQPGGQPGLHPGSEGVQEAGALAGLGRWRDQAEQDGEHQRADGETMGLTR